MNRLNRRQFVSSAAALLAGGLLEAQAADQREAADIPSTGQRHPALVSFDRLMTSFVAENQVPGAALAVTRNGRLVYARGFGLADRRRQEAVEPEALFRIASVSKPFTAVAVLRLVEQRQLALEDHVFGLLGLEPHLEREGKVDPRLKRVTVLEVLQHRGGWNRDQSFDPMFRPLRIARALGVEPPAGPEHIIRYMWGQPLDFDPGKEYAYSNFGYCVLGRVIEKVSGQPYEQFVRREVLRPLGIRGMRLGKTLEEDRAAGEVHYYDEKQRTGKAVVGPDLGKRVPLPYGAWYLEAMDAHGGWIASAVDLVRFAAALDDPDHCPLLSATSIQTMFARPEGAAGWKPNGKPRDAYYGCGWEVRPVGPRGEHNTWHMGALDGTSSLLVRRNDGLNWAVLFNTGANPQGKGLADLIDPLVHEAADAVRSWPERDLFEKYLGR